MISTSSSDVSQAGNTPANVTSLSHHTGKSDVFATLLQNFHPQKPASSTSSSVFPLSLANNSTIKKNQPNHRQNYPVNHQLAQQAASSGEQTSAKHAGRKPEASDHSEQFSSRKIKSNSQKDAPPQPVDDQKQPANGTVPDMSSPAAISAAQKSTSHDVNQDIAEQPKNSQAQTTDSVTTDLLSKADISPPQITTAQAAVNSTPPSEESLNTAQSQAKATISQQPNAGKNDQIVALSQLVGNNGHVTISQENNIPQPAPLAQSQTDNSVIASQEIAGQSDQTDISPPQNIKNDLTTISNINPIEERRTSPTDGQHNHASSQNERDSSQNSMNMQSRQALADPVRQSPVVASNILNEPVPNSQETLTEQNNASPDLSITAGHMQHSGFPSNRTISANDAITSQTQIPASSSPADQVAAHLSKNIQIGNDSVTVELTPEHLGKVEVKLTIIDGMLQVAVTADNPDTLKMLQGDSKNLQQSLQNAGFQTDANSMNFHLRSDQQQQFAHDKSQDQESGGTYRHAHQYENAPGTLLSPVGQSVFSTNSLQALDITV